MKNNIGDYASSAYRAISKINFYGHELPYQAWLTPPSILAGRAVSIIKNEAKVIWGMRQAVDAINNEIFANKGKIEIAKLGHERAREELQRCGIERIIVNNRIGLGNSLSVPAAMILLKAATLIQDEEKKLYRASSFMDQVPAYIKIERTKAIISATTFFEFPTVLNPDLLP
ncbi:MAG: hypothetical protein PHH14_02915 [Candidatus Margulisbacteria bacterium]|nr:hypothetical protein [Candidatus Margulisiibacteriota bacterium]